MKKLIIFLCVIVTSSMAFAATYPVPLLFVNCTNQEVRVSNEISPYKFSLNASEPATNGFSKPATFTVPATMIYKYDDATVFINSYTDGGMHLQFSGGINGHAGLSQKSAGIPASCFGGDSGCSASAYIDIISSDSDNQDIEFLNPSQMLIQSGKAYTKNNLVISLGCKSH